MNMKAAAAARCRSIGIALRALTNAKKEMTFTHRHFPKRKSRGKARRALLNRADLLASLAEATESNGVATRKIAKQYPDVHFSPNYELSRHMRACEPARSGVSRSCRKQLLIGTFWRAPRISAS